MQHKARSEDSGVAFVEPTEARRLALCAHFSRAGSKQFPSHSGKKDREADNE